MNNLEQFIQSTRRKLPQFRKGKDSAVEKAHEDRLRKLYNLVECRLAKGSDVRVFCQSAYNYGNNIFTIRKFPALSSNAIEDFWMSFIKKSEGLILADFEEKLINANVDDFREVLITFKRKHPQLFNEVKGLLGNLSNLSQQKKDILPSYIL